MGGLERQCLRKHKRLSRSDHKKEINKINILFVVVVVICPADSVENPKNPCSACLFTFSESNLHRGKALGFLLADCGNLFRSSLFSFAKTRFFSQNSFLEFSTFFSTSNFRLFHTENQNFDFFGAFFRVFNKRDIFSFNSDKPFYQKDVHTWICGKFLIKRQLFHKFSTPVENLVENLNFAVDFYAWPVISFFMSPISRENIASIWSMESALLYEDMMVAWSRLKTLEMFGKDISVISRMR